MLFLAGSAGLLFRRHGPPAIPRKPATGWAVPSGRYRHAATPGSQATNQRAGTQPKTANTSLVNP